jgi:uncharacterized membrane protein YbhN (UPF0104 family)
LPIAALVAVCLVLVAADLAMRALRIQFFLKGAGYPLSYREVFVLNAFGDAASVVTPLRIGGEPARLGGMLFAGVPVAAAIPLLAVEVVSYSVVVAAAAFIAGLFYAPGWWRGVGPGIIESVKWAIPWVVAVVVLSVVLWWVVSRRRAHGRGPKQRIAWGSVRGALGWPLAASVPLTLLSVACRVAVLPVLAQSLPAPPPVHVLAVSSFALIYGQLFLPTPGGAGAIELLFSSGAAGNLGGSLGTVFILWRACTTGIPVVVGFGLAIPRYGLAAVRLALRGRHSHGEASPAPSPQPPPPPAGAQDGRGGDRSA